jgi:hypothetical protein
VSIITKEMKRAYLRDLREDRKILNEQIARVERDDFTDNEKILVPGLYTASIQALRWGKRG